MSPLQGEYRSAQSEGTPESPATSTEQTLTATERALARLEASRVVLRRTLVPEPELPDSAGAAPRRLHALLRFVRRRWAHSILAGAVVEGLQHWWMRHPWRPPAEAAFGELERTAGPVLRRHPLAAVAVAAALGAAVVVARPWRWPLVANHLAPLPRRAGHWLMTQLAQPAVQAWLTGLALSLFDRTKPPSGA